MAKTYPVILYPRLINKFLADNPVSSGKNRGHAEAERELEKAASSQSSGWSIFLGLTIFSGVLVVCLYFLKPGWLAACSWLLMGMGYLSWLRASKGRGVRKNTRPCDKLTGVSQGKSLSQSRSWIREQQLIDLLNGRLLTPARISFAMQGVSEKRFFTQLKAIFPEIQQGMEFDNPQFSFPYSADFAFIHDCGVGIDIEVDEPYVGNTKQPHHCTDQGKDEIRNAFFVQNNWIVLRFSEEQVVRYPLSCCLSLASIIAQVCGDSRFIDQLEGVPQLPKSPMWTINQAKKLAREDYRQTYLKLAKR
jgi:very-short-patch-repair endonuclease